MPWTLTEMVSNGRAWESAKFARFSHTSGADFFLESFTLRRAVVSDSRPAGSRSFFSRLHADHRVAELANLAAERRDVVGGEGAAAVVRVALSVERAGNLRSGTREE